MKGASGFTGFARAARRHQRQTGLPGEAGALTAGGGQNGAGGCAAWVGSQGWCWITEPRCLFITFHRVPRGPWCESPARSRFSRPGTQQPSQGTAALAPCASALAAKSHAAESGFMHVSWVGFSSPRLCRRAAKCVSVQELSREIRVTGEAEDWLCQLALQRTSVLPPCRMLSE